MEVQVGMRNLEYKWVALSNTTLGMLIATINASILLIALPDIFRGIGIDPLAPGNILRPRRLTPHDPICRPHELRPNCRSRLLRRSPRTNYLPLLTLWRLLRCHPFCRGGLDPVKLPEGTVGNGRSG